MVDGPGLFGLDIPTIRVPPKAFLNIEAMLAPRARLPAMVSACREYFRSISISLHEVPLTGRRTDRFLESSGRLFLTVQFWFCHGRRGP